MTPEKSTENLRRDLRFRLFRLTDRAKRMDHEALVELWRHLDEFRDEARARNALRREGAR